jgi:phosphoglycerate dehydrogenase-like enzyme
VNTSRGPIIERAALLAVLKGGKIGGAALDVFDEEPLPAGDELRRLDNVVATPHVGYVSRENYAVMYRVTAENIAAFLAGKPQNVIEP